MKKKQLNYVKISQELREAAFENNMKAFKNAKSVTHKGVKMTEGKKLLAELEAVYLLITNKPLSTHCEDCIVTALKIVRNYCKHYIPEVKKVETKIVEIDESEDEKTEIVELSQDFDELLSEREKEDTIKQLENMKLSDLKNLYPHVTSNSKKGFIEKLLKSE